MTTPAEHRELEWQLAATELDSVRQWLAERAGAAGWRCEPRATVEHHDTYLDTDDWRIHRAGFALRVRAAAGRREATLKELRPAQEGFADRRELSEPLADTGREPAAERDTAAGHDVAAWADPVGARVRAVAGARALRPLFKICTHRERFGIGRAGSTVVAGELALDATTIAAPDGAVRARLQRVEVEASGTDTEPLDEFVLALRRECALAPAQDSKYACGLAALALAPPAAPELGPTGIDRDMRIDEVGYAVLRQSLLAWYANEPGARLGDDTEALHDLRVAGRRMESALGFFESALPATLVRLRPRLKQVVRTLGTTRDLDVALGQLEAFRRELAPSGQGALDVLRRRLAAERLRARAKMLRALDAAVTLRTLARLERLITRPAGQRRRSRCPPAVEVMPGLLRARYRTLRKTLAPLTADSPAGELHAARGKVKHLRYATEAATAIYGKPAEEFLRVLRQLQNRLGEQHDAHVAQARLHALTLHPPQGFTAATMFQLGRMAERYAAVDRQARRGIEKQRDKLRKRWQKLRRRMDKTNAPVSLPARSPDPDSGP